MKISTPRSLFTNPQNILWSTLILTGALTFAIFLYWAGSTIYYQATFHPTGKIAYLCAKALCTINADGTGYEQSSFLGGSVVSPDGKQVTSSDEYLVIINADGSLYAQFEKSGLFLTDKSSWSPNGEYVSVPYTNQENSLSGIAIFNIEKKEQTLLTKEAETNPVWSSDGKHVAISYENKESNLSGIAIFDIDIRERVFLTKEMEKDPTWSPDGKRLAFTTSATKNIHRTKVSLVNSDGSGQVEIVNEPNDVYNIGFRYPAWSYDGKKIAFSRYYIEGVFVVNVDGSGLTRLTNTGSDPSWSPDGEYIVYSDGMYPWCRFLPCNNPIELRIMRTNGSQDTRLIGGKNPVWMP